MDRKEISKTISNIEASKGISPLLASSNLRIAITGNSGNGKSTLLSNLLANYNLNNQEVACLLVDPASYDKGAFLADRSVLINNQKNHFIRSYALRNNIETVNLTIDQITRYLSNHYNKVFLETSGSSQSDRIISYINDLVILTISANSGNELQFLKSGIIEYADLIVVTKSDISKNVVYALNTNKPVIETSTNNLESFKTVYDYIENLDINEINKKREIKEKLWLKELFKYNFGILNYNKNIKDLDNLINNLNSSLSLEQKLEFLVKELI